MDDEPCGHGPEILEELRRSHAAHAAGDREGAMAIVEELREQYGGQVDLVLSALRVGILTLEDGDGTGD